MSDSIMRVSQVGDQMPALALTDINGGEIELSTFAGKKYIIYMWASW
ncbi:MAG: hypothetical protein AAF702_19270 [Chloroflexota bacterium]